MVDAPTTVAIDSNDQSHRIVFCEWPDRLQVDVIHEQRVTAGDDWRVADLKEIHPLVYRGTTTLCMSTKTRYDHGIAIASHRTVTEHLVVIRPVKAGDRLVIVHERCGPDEDTWTTVGNHHIRA